MINIQNLIEGYTLTTGIGVCVYDRNYQIYDNKSGVEKNICAYCPKNQKNASEDESELCCNMHINAIRESINTGGIHIYPCEMGLMFWVSPIFSDGRFSGALRGAAFVDSDTKAAQEITEEFTELLKTMQSEDSSKIQALAEVLFLCAASLSAGIEDQHELIMRRTEQQRDITEKIKELEIIHSDGSSPVYPVEKERQLVAALRRGDAASAADYLNDLLAVLFFSNKNNFENIQLCAIELAVLISRVDVDSGQEGISAPQISSTYIKQIKKSKAFEELADVLHTVSKQTAGIIASYQGIPHAAAMRRAERYIHQNFTRKISLSEIAAVAGLSAPYFSTIFKEEMGENLSRYLNCLRVDKAAHMLLETNFSLSDIASACCFEDQSWFSKIFKSYTGISPGKFRSQGGAVNRYIADD